MFLLGASPLALRDLTRFHVAAASDPGALLSRLIFLGEIRLSACGWGDPPAALQLLVCFWHTSVQRVAPFLGARFVGGVLGGNAFLISGCRSRQECYGA